MDMLGELVLWVTLPVLAKVLNSSHVVCVSEFCLAYILAGHSWSKTIAAFLVIRICRWITEVVREAIIPEVKQYACARSAEMYKRDGLNVASVRTYTIE